MNNCIITDLIGNLEIPGVSSIQVRDKETGELIKTAGGIWRKDINSGSSYEIDLSTIPILKSDFTKINGYIRSLPAIPHKIYLDFLKGSILGYIKVESSAEVSHVGRIEMKLTITEV